MGGPTCAKDRVDRNSIPAATNQPLTRIRTIPPLAEIHRLSAIAELNNQGRFGGHMPVKPSTGMWSLLPWVDLRPYFQCPSCMT